MEQRFCCLSYLGGVWYTPIHLLSDPVKQFGKFPGSWDLFFILLLLPPLLLISHRISTLLLHLIIVSLHPANCLDVSPTGGEVLGPSGGL
jgi:hypothetical protein